MVCPNCQFLIFCFFSNNLFCSSSSLFSSLKTKQQNEFSSERVGAITGALE
jgi:hypothetical protein